jgi:uncharacterized membrane protein YfcA
MVIGIIAGSLLGFLSGLGTGGGSLLILWLTFGLGWDNEAARLANLMFFVPAAIIACCFRCSQGKLSIKKVLPGMVAASLSALAFSFWRKSIDPWWIKKLFGVLLLFTGFRELLYREQKRK